jgi:hypothetical protein
MQGDVEAIREVWDRVEPSFYPVMSQPQNPPIPGGDWGSIGPGPPPDLAGFHDFDRPLPIPLLSDTKPPNESLEQKLDALREAGGKAWDDIADPEAYLKETTG